MHAGRADAAHGAVARSSPWPTIQRRSGKSPPQLDGLRFFYRASAVPPPDGAPAIVHVHGFAISGRYLMPTAWRLAPEFRTYVPDLPGFGRSERPDHPYAIPELADALGRFMDQVGVERATLLGNSLGCPIIGEFLDHFPDRAERVIFVSPAGGLYNQPFIRRASHSSSWTPCASRRAWESSSSATISPYGRRSPR